MLSNPNLTKVPEWWWCIAKECLEMVHETDTDLEEPFNECKKQ
jgi:hypothetical protein